MKKNNDPTTFRKHLAGQLKNSEFRQEWDRVDPEFKVFEALADLRRDKELSQRELAKRMKATQAQIARLERGGNTSVKTLQRIAAATDTTLKIEFIRR